MDEGIHGSQLLRAGLFILIVVVTFLQSTEAKNIQIISNGKTQDRAKRDLFDWTLLYPGTKWCGKGNSASSYDDLGSEVETDKCCRAHDLCQHNIEPLTSEYCYFNWRLFAISHCDCEDSFYDCLTAVNTFAADAVKYTYFNVLDLDCFTLETQTTCVDYFWFFCIQYETHECADIQ